jgi:hypothetical protein
MLRMKLKFINGKLQTANTSFYASNTPAAKIASKLFSAITISMKPV